MTMLQLAPSQVNPEVPVNENFDVLSHMATYGKRAATTTGLTWGYYGGRWGGFLIADGTLTLAASTVNYTVVAKATGVASVSATTTNWNDVANYARAYKLTTGATTVTATEDHRAGPGGVAAAAGASGSSGGGASGLEMTVSTTTTDADPGTGVIRWNNATQASATQLFIDNADSNSAALATLWAATASGAFLKIILASDSDNWQLWKVTATPINGTGYYKFTVTLEASNGAAFANGAAVLLDVDQAGAPAMTAQAVAFQLAASDRTTALATGTNVASFRAPFAFTITAVRASVDTASTSGAPEINVKKNGTTIFSTNLTIDATEKTSVTAATPPVVSVTAVADDDEITVDIVAAGTGTKGLIVSLIGTKP